MNYKEYQKVEQVIENNIKPNLGIIKEMKVKGISDRNIAKVLGISLQSFNKAKEVFEPLEKAYEDGSEELRAKLLDVVYSRALGTDGRKDKNGELLPADEKLAWEIIKKVDDRYKDKTEVKVDNSITLTNLIKEIGMEKRKEEKEEDDGEWL